VGVNDQNRHPVAHVRQRRPQATQDVFAVNYPEPDSLTGQGHPCLTGRCYSGRWKPNPGPGRFISEYSSIV